MARKQNIGRDLSVSVSVNGAVIRQFGLHTSTHIKPLWTERTVVPTNNGGLNVTRAVFNGYEVDLTANRQNGVPDTLQQFLEDTYKAGDPDAVVTMLETVRNDDRSVDQFQYLDGTIFQQDAGDFKGNEDVSQQWRLRFAERIQIGGDQSLVTLGNGLGLGI